LRQVAAGDVLSVLHVTLLAMSADTPAALAWLVAYQHGVLARPQIVSAGVADDWLRHRIRLGGPWQRLLPGIYLTTTGQPTRDQLQVAAALFAGAESVITGWAALRNYKIRVQRRASSMFSSLLTGSEEAASTSRFTALAGCRCR
jgi:hypothetical protein